MYSKLSSRTTGNKTVVANWTANTYSVKYNGNGSTSGTMSNSSHTYDTAKTLTLNSFEKVGYNFVGWATSSTGSVVYSDGQSVSNLTTTNGGTVNLYAIWEAKGTSVKVSGAYKAGDTYVKNGGTWHFGDEVYVKVNGVWKLQV